MGSARITRIQINKYRTCREMNMSVASAAREAKVSEGWAKKYEMKLRNIGGDGWREIRREAEFDGPIPYNRLNERALQGWDDFEYFRRTYMGHISTPWQTESAYRILESVSSPNKEFWVLNTPPGVGKTTLMHDVAAWLTVRDRRVRGLFGSRIENNARRQLRRLRRTFERTTAPQAREDEIAKGISVDAIACLAEDYGLMKPLTSDIWKNDEFVVAQFDNVPIEEKEPTWSSYGQNSGILGNRFNLILWDDVVDKVSTRTTDAIEEQRLWFDEEAETRLEPEGSLFLVGQRMAASDLYRYCLDKMVEAEPDVEGADPEEAVDRLHERPHLYQHILYKSHYPELCQLQHGRLAPTWPNGCLLDPYRLPWGGSGGLKAIQSTKPHVYRVSYQQEDADPDDVLVPPVWITGGTSPDDGTLSPGCEDKERDLLELPPGLERPFYSIATVDPSGTKRWALQWWIHAPNASNQTFLMDLESRSMPANELLDWNANMRTFYGLMEEWQSRSVDLGWPITHWIIEVNAAQRYLLAYEHVRRWQSKWGVQLIPHTTTLRKLDPSHGPWIVRDHFKFGRIRLPRAQGPVSNARLKSSYLIQEVTHWPNAGVTDDQVMAMWFLFAHLPRLTYQGGGPKRYWRPSWLRAS